MPRFSAWKLFLMLFFPSFAVPVIFAVSPNHKLIALVPPGTQIVDGMVAPSDTDRRGNFVIATHNSFIDFQDFFALTGADSSRIVREVVLTAALDSSGKLSERSLLASGRFDKERIYASATRGGATVTGYRGITVLSVEPFPRERAEFDDVRWLAVLDSDVLLFGGITTLRQELDRYLAGSVVDLSLVRRLDRLRGDDGTWCLVSVTSHSDTIRDALASLDPTLARLIWEGGAFQFGIRYGRRIEFEYEVTTSSPHDSEAVSKSIAASLAGPDVKGSSLISHADAGGVDGAVHGIVRISKRRYEEWLKEVYSHTPD